MNRPFQSRLHIDYSTNIHHSQLRSTDYPDCYFMATLSWGKPPGPRIIRKLWSNTCERTHRSHKEHAEDSSYLKNIEVMLGETARKSYPENDDNPMIAPRDHEVRQVSSVGKKVKEQLRRRMKGRGGLTNVRGGEVEARNFVSSVRLEESQKQRQLILIPFLARTCKQFLC